MAERPSGRERGTMPLAIYRGLMRAVAPGASHWLARRVKRGKEDPARLSERYGQARSARPPGPLVWIHAASVGETNSVLPIIRRFTADGVAVLLTTMTVTAARIAAERLPVGAVHQFVPLDVPAYADAFLTYWRPDVAVFVEQELWPNLLLAAEVRGIPLALINARLSPRSFARWQRLAGTMRHLLSAFSIVLAQSRGDGDRLSALGARRVETVGNLKFDVPAPGADDATLRRLRAALAGRPAWTAASTQPGEETQVLLAHRAVRSRIDGACLMLAPRHPPRGDEVETLVREAGLSLARRSRGEWPDGDTAVFLLDTLGELGLVYRAAPLAFLGGSLVPHGGQNPIEPAKLGAAVLHGPHVHNFAEVFAAIDAAGGGEAVGDADTLAERVIGLLSDSEAITAAGGRARAAVEALGGGLAGTYAALSDLLSARPRT